MQNFSDIGRLGQDPDVRYFESGRGKVSFSLAIDSAERERDSNKPQTIWLPCEAWINVDGTGVGNVIANYCEKGVMVAVAGQLKQEEYTDKQDVDRKIIKLVVKEVKLLPKATAKPSEPAQAESEEDDSWADDKPAAKEQPKAKQKKSDSKAYATTASKGKAYAAQEAINSLADGDLPELNDIPF